MVKRVNFPTRAKANRRPTTNMMSPVELFSLMCSAVVSSLSIVAPEVVNVSLLIVASDLDLGMAVKRSSSSCPVPKWTSSSCPVPKRSSSSCPVPRLLCGFGSKLQIAPSPVSHTEDRELQHLMMKDVTHMKKSI